MPDDGLDKPRIDIQTLTQRESSQSGVPPLMDEILQNTGGTPEAIKTHLEKLSFEDFVSLLNRLNGYFRGNSEEQEMDGAGLMADGYMPPDPQDRRTLMHEAYEKAMAEESPVEAAFVLGMSILTIHPYIDGNGRTSRTIFALLTNGYSGSDEDGRLFSAIGAVDEDENGYHRNGRGAIDLDPGSFLVDDRFTLTDRLIVDMQSKAIENRLGKNASEYPVRVGISRRDREFNANSQLSEEQQTELADIFGSGGFAYVACMNSFTDKLYTISLKRVNFDKQENDIIAYKNIIEVITPEDFERLKNEFRLVRIAYVRAAMNVTDLEEFQFIEKHHLDKLRAWIMNSN